MSAKLLRSGTEQVFATNHEAIGGVTVHGRMPTNRWLGVSASERKTVGRIASVKWKRARLPCRRDNGWR
jgi:hypothetical protein